MRENKVKMRVNLNILLVILGIFIIHNVYFLSQVSVIKNSLPANNIGEECMSDSKCTQGFCITSLSESKIRELKTAGDTIKGECRWGCGYHVQGGTVPTFEGDKLSYMCWCVR